MLASLSIFLCTHSEILLLNSILILQYLYHISVNIAVYLAHLITSVFACWFISFAAIDRKLRLRYSRNIKKEPNISTSANNTRKKKRFFSRSVIFFRHVKVFDSSLARLVHCIALPLGNLLLLRHSPYSVYVFMSCTLQESTLFTVANLVFYNPMWVETKHYSLRGIFGLLIH